MEVLAFSDLHRNLEHAGRVVSKAAKADVVIGAGDFSTLRRGLDRMIEALSAITVPTVLVPGNHESDAVLRGAVERRWPAATVLHGSACSVAKTAFYGLGGAVPPTPFPWGFDVTEEDAERRLRECPPGCVLVVHSPPRGHLDRAMGRHLGSRAILDAITRTRPRLVVCGHIHQHWGEESTIGPTRILNAGPYGTLLRI